MVDTGYLYSKNNKRLFINLSLGCASSCSYCYLDKLGFSNGQYNLDAKTSDEIKSMINGLNVEVNENTLISFGCYSECFSDATKYEVVKLIEHFIHSGNVVQVSTKKSIDFSMLESALSSVKHYGQFVIFTSCSTISRHDEYEGDTDEVNMRFKNFEHISEVPVVLYIKPVIEGVTIEDIDEYVKYIKMYGIKDVVVGSIFDSKGFGEKIPMSSENIYYHPCSDEDIIIDALSKYARVSKRSTKVLELYNSREL